MTPYILLVDDEKEFLNDQQKLLRKYGIQYRYTTRAHGIEKAFDNTKIDFIHLDILLDPRAKDTDWKKPTGLSMIHKVLRTRGLEIPIMIISGHIDVKAKEMAEEEYGLKDLIVNWYQKPVEYERVLMDTIKEINEKEFKKTKELMLDYARASANENYSLIKTALTTMPMIKHDIALDPNLLLGALESLSFRLLKLFSEPDEEESVEFSITGESGGSGEGKFERYTRNFKEIVTGHICDYFRNSTDNHRILAESLAALIAKVDLRDDQFKTGVVWESMLDIIELFRKDVLKEDDIYAAGLKMEEVFGVRTGLAFDTPGKLNQYLELAMKRG
jgi:FixJ family two-component response regulator